MVLSRKFSIFATKEKAIIMIFWIKNPLEANSTTDSLLGVILYLDSRSLTMKSQTFAVGTLKYLLSHPDVSLSEFAEDLESLTDKLAKYVDMSCGDINNTPPMMRSVNQYWQTYIPGIRSIVSPFAEKYNLKLEEQYE